MRKIVEKVPDDILMADLERYRQEAIKLGATDAKIISSSEIIIDERVLMKCLYPKCPFYGTNVNCPPYAAKPQEMRDVINKYRYAIFFTIQGSAETVAGPRDVRRRAAVKLTEITARLEARAFYDGYYLSLGFAAGACKGLFCSDKECSALKPGQACSQELKARGSLESIGIDAYLMAAKFGWDIYPCGRSTKVEDVPLGRRVGLVLIY